MKRLFLSILIAMAIISCTPTRETYKLLDDEHKTFFVNGVSAIEGYEAVVKGLEDIGFEMGNVEKVDLSIFGQGVHLYTLLTNTRPLTRNEFGKLTNGLFVDLPSGDAILNEVNSGRCGVYLSWLPSGIVNEVVVQVSNSSIKEDAIEINKRLASIFPYSKVGNKSMGFMTYYNENGVEVYYTNDYFLSIKKK